MKERTHTIAKEKLIDFDPQQMVHELKEKGFEFESDACPIKLAGNGGVERNPDGSVTFRQTIEN